MDQCLVEIEENGLSGWGVQGREGIDDVVEGEDFAGGGQALGGGRYGLLIVIWELLEDLEALPAGVALWGGDLGEPREDLDEAAAA